MSTDWGDTISAFLQILLMAVATAFVPVLVKLLADYVKAWIAKGSAELTEQQRVQLKWILETVVLAAEQSGLADQVRWTGAQKKAYALNLAEKLIKDQGLTIDLDPLADLIEAEVMRQFNWDKGFAKVEGLAPATQEAVSP